jgi:antitoxin (DNA-binding transcriptional repressor) of toxin-antitoxin stability system
MPQPTQQERSAAIKQASQMGLVSAGKAFARIVPRQPLNRIDRATLAEMGKTDGEELCPETPGNSGELRGMPTLVMGDSGPWVCAELDSDGDGA